MWRTVRKKTFPCVLARITDIKMFGPGNNFSGESINEIGNYSLSHGTMQIEKEKEMGVLRVNNTLWYEFRFKQRLQKNKKINPIRRLSQKSQISSLNWLSVCMQRSMSMVTTRTNRKGPYPRIDIYMKISSLKEDEQSRFIGCTTHAPTIEDALTQFCLYNDIDNSEKIYYAQFAPEEVQKT